MFKKFENKDEANHFAKSLSSLMKFSTFNEDKKDVMYGSSGEVVYTAITDDFKWRMDITFPTAVNKDKSHYPEITFKANGISMGSILAAKGRTIANHFETAYKPDFNQVFMVIDAFIKTGVESKMIHSVEEIWKEGNMQDFFGADDFSQYLKFKAKKVSLLSFNRLLQKGKGYQKSTFKKSYITTELIHLVVGSTLQPFFKIRLPFVNDNKMTVLVPINATEKQPTKMYFTDNDHQLKQGLFGLFTLSLDNEKIENYFAGRFNSLIKSSICSALHLKKTELDNLSQEELNDYFLLLEMAKI